MSGGIGQAMHYTVTISQCPVFEMYKCLSVFSKRITVKEVDVCRHLVDVVSLWTLKKRTLIEVHCVLRPSYNTFTCI